MILAVARICPNMILKPSGATWGSQRCLRVLACVGSGRTDGELAAFSRTEWDGVAPTVGPFQIALVPHNLVEDATAARRFIAVHLGRRYLRYHSPTASWRPFVPLAAGQIRWRQARPVIRLSER